MSSEAKQEDPVQKIRTELAVKEQQIERARGDLARCESWIHPPSPSENLARLRFEELASEGTALSDKLLSAVLERQRDKDARAAATSAFVRASVGEHKELREACEKMLLAHWGGHVFEITQYGTCAQLIYKWEGESADLVQFIAGGRRSDGWLPFIGEPTQAYLETARKWQEANAETRLKLLPEIVETCGSHTPGIIAWDRVLACQRKEFSYILEDKIE